MTNFFRIDLTASLLAISAGIIHLGAYWGLWWTPPASAIELYWRVGISIGLMIIAIIGVTIASTLTNRRAPASDERENSVLMRAMRNMLLIYSGGLAIIFMEAFDGMRDPMALAHSVIGIFILAEVIRVTSLWWYFRQPF